MQNDLDAILSKAGQFGVDLKKLRVVHVDDEPFVLKHTEEDLRGIIGDYKGFTNPEEATQWIIQHSADIDFLILDQFIARDYRQLEGNQGTDILRRICERKIIIPSIIFSGEHAKSDCFSLLEALNKANDVAEYRSNVITLRNCNLSPVAYVPKETRFSELLLNMIGLVAMKREFMDAGYEGFFNTFKGGTASTPKYDLAKLAYEKSMVLFDEAKRFARRFSDEYPQADVVNPSAGNKFSDVIFEKCGFSEGIQYQADEVAQLDDSKLAYYNHQFSHTFRSIVPMGIEDAVVWLDNYDILANYMHFLMSELSLGKKDVVDYIHSNSAVMSAVDSIINFKKGVAALGFELRRIHSKLGNAGLSSEGVEEILNLHPSLKADYEGNVKDASVYTDRIGVSFIIAEILHNAEKVARQRRITPEINASVSEYSFGELPEQVRLIFQGYNLQRYKAEVKGFDGSLSNLRFIRISITDNCGGFEGDVGDYLKGGSSKTGSTGKGLSLLRSSQEEILYALNVNSQQGKGATFDLYFVRAD